MPARQGNDPMMPRVVLHLDPISLRRSGVVYGASMNLT